jgi:hypothetical protein
MEPRMAFEPGIDLGVFVRGVVVRDQVQVEFGRSLLIDQREELADRRNALRRQTLDNEYSALPAPACTF